MSLYLLRGKISTFNFSRLMEYGSDEGVSAGYQQIEPVPCLGYKYLPCLDIWTETLDFAMVLEALNRYIPQIEAVLGGLNIKRPLCSNGTTGCLGAERVDCLYLRKYGLETVQDLCVLRN